MTLLLLQGVSATWLAERCRWPAWLVSHTWPTDTHLTLGNHRRKTPLSNKLIP